MLDTIKERYSHLPDKKKWIDLLIAVLTVPVLITVIVANLNNINKKDEAKRETQPTPQIVVKLSEGEEPISQKQELETAPIPTPNLQDPDPTEVNCSGDLSPWEIKKPVEGETVTSDPVVVDLELAKDKDYCDHEWAYRVNGSSFTTYSNSPVYLYNMASGPVKLELKLRNKVSGKESSLVRKFIYEEEITATPTLSATPSVIPTQTL